MTLAEIWNNIQSSAWIYFLMVIAVILIFVVYQQLKKRRYLQQNIDKDILKLNEIKSHTFSVDIAKCDAIARVNPGVKETAIQCKTDYDTIIELSEKVNNLLLDASETLQTSGSKKCAEMFKEIDPMMSTLSALADKLSNTLSAVLSQSTLQRKKINELKSEFHNIKTVINANPNNYTFCWEQLDRITVAISHQFSDFENLMDASRFEDAAVLSEAISKNIEALYRLVEKVPELIVETRQRIPERLRQITTSFMLLSKDGIYLDHLDFNNTIISITDRLEHLQLLIKQCRIDNISDEVLDMHAKINQIEKDLDVEKNSYKELVKSSAGCESLLAKGKHVLDKVRNAQDNDFQRYVAKNLSKDFLQCEEEYVALLNSYNDMVAIYKQNSQPISQVVGGFAEVESNLKSIYDKIINLESTLSDSRNSEIRIKTLLSKFTLALNESIASINSSKLPKISDKYEKDIKDAEDKIRHIAEELENNEVDIDRLKDETDETQKLIIGLYKNVNNLIDTAREVEDFIINCNKYRPYYPEVDSALFNAELAYTNGEYTKATKIAANALMSINPDLASELTESLNKKLALVKED